MLLIGSHALRFHGIETGRKAPDIDLVGTFDELEQLTRCLRQSGPVDSIPLTNNKTVLRTKNTLVEFEIAWSDSTSNDLVGRFLTQAVGEKKLLGQTVYVPPLDILYTLKMSHRYLKNSPHFRKTRHDIMLLRSRGAKIHDEEWLKQREAETYTYKHPKLNVMKGDFFKGDGVDYVYDHDTIHTAMAHILMPECDLPEASYSWVPAYRMYMADGAEVKSSKKKFFDTSEKVRLYGVLEEIQVLALERSQIPFKGKVDPRKSFDIAAMKVCTSITSGWFREFAWENLHKVESMYEANYVDRFWKAVDDGIVKLNG